MEGSNIEQEQIDQNQDYGHEEGQEENLDEVYGQEDGEGHPEDEHADLVKAEVLELYKDKCDEAGIEPHQALCVYLEETYDENLSIDLVIQGNDKFNFTDRVDDVQLKVICSTLERYAVYIEEVDLRFNKITDEGAKALGDLIQRSPKLAALNLQGNNIKSEGA